MHMMIRSFLAILISICCLAASGQTCPIIPMPQSAERAHGEFLLTSQSGLYVESELLGHAANYLQRRLLEYRNLPLSRRAGHRPAPGSRIRLEIRKQLKPESYTLKMEPGEILISGGDSKGVFYGVVSLLQLLRQGASVPAGVKLKCWNIEDAPAYPWRGFMLDASRHFIPVDQVKKVLDWMAFYKLNRLHWHLTDEPAWRIEIKKYPRLARIGGTGDYLDPDLPAAWYTQQDIAEIVDYAAEREIQVIPEIDMPGHATAANRAYPEFSGGGSPAHPEFTFDPGNPGTYGYLSDILSEVDALFPLKILHLGGDEVSFGSEAWRNNAGIRSLMEQHDLPDLRAVERYFMQRMADSVFAMDARVAVWDELADASLRKDKTIIYWWRQDKPEQFFAALKNGYQVVVCPRLPLYFDFVQDSTHQYGRKWAGKFNPIDSVYTYSIQAFQKAAASGQILGFQGNLWTERVHSREKLEFMIFPRIAALAELAWTRQENKDLTRFKSLLSTHLEYYKSEGIYYYDPLADIHPEPDLEDGHKKHRINH